MVTKMEIKEEIIRYIDEHPEFSLVSDIGDLHDIACDTTINGVRIEDDDMLYNQMLQILDVSFLSHVQDFCNIDVNGEIMRDYNSQRL